MGSPSRRGSRDLAALSLNPRPGAGGLLADPGHRAEGGGLPLARRRKGWERRIVEKLIATFGPTPTRTTTAGTPVFRRIGNAYSWSASSRTCRYVLRTTRPRGKASPQGAGGDEGLISDPLDLHLHPVLYLAVKVPRKEASRAWPPLRASPRRAKERSSSKNLRCTRMWSSSSTG
jgi:hypothetical protein